MGRTISGHGLAVKPFLKEIVGRLQGDYGGEDESEEEDEEGLLHFRMGRKAVSCEVLTESFHVASSQVGTTLPSLPRGRMKSLPM